MKTETKIEAAVSAATVGGGLLAARLKEAGVLAAPFGSWQLTPEKHDFTLILKNPTDVELSYSPALFIGYEMGTDFMSTKSVPGGSTESWSGSLDLSGLSGKYDVYLSVWCKEADETIMKREKVGTVTIKAVADVTFQSLSWD